MASPQQQMLQLQQATERLIELQVQFAGAISSSVDRMNAARPTTSRPKACLPEPEKFNGTATKWDTWLPSIEAKLLVDAEAIGNPTAQFYYVYLNLESQAQSMVLPQLATAKETGSWDYQTILDQLAKAYDSPTKVQDAEEKLLKCVQGTDSLSVYIARFERLLHEARCTAWPDHSKIISFRQGLNSTIRNRLAAQLALPSEYSAYLSVVRQLSSRSVHFSTPSGAPASGPSAILSGRPHSNSHSRGDYHHSQSNSRGGEPMDLSNLEPAEISTIDINYLGEATPSDSTLMADLQAHLNVIEGKCYPSRAQAERWRKKRCCINCGDSEHHVKDCPWRSDRISLAQLRELHGNNCDGDLEGYETEDDGGGNL